MPRVPRPLAAAGLAFLSSCLHPAAKASFSPDSAPDRAPEAASADSGTPGQAEAAPAESTASVGTAPAPEENATSIPPAPSEPSPEPGSDAAREVHLGDTYIAPQPEESYGLSGGWGGVRRYLEEHGLTLGFQAYLEGNSVLDGGLRRRTSLHALYDLTTTFDLDRIAGWKDAQLVMEAYVIGGQNPSENVGDTQSFSDISGPEVSEIAQLYCEKWFADRTCRLKLGKMDANSDFAAPANGIESIHSSAAFSPTNFTMVTYPNPATGILAGWVPNESWYLNLALYDGATWAGYNTGTLGPTTFFGDPADLFWIAEAGRRWKLGENELAGGISLGAWRHTGLFTDTGGNDVHNTSAWYATLDQELGRAAEGESGGTKSGFLQFGQADEDVAAIDRHLGLGFNWAGLCAARADDALGFYVSQAHFSRGFGFTADETAWELDYKCQCCAGVVLRPDLQYIANPGGDASVDDALVFSLRCELDF